MDLEQSKFAPIVALNFALLTNDKVVLKALTCKGTESRRVYNEALIVY